MTLLHRYRFTCLVVVGFAVAGCGSEVTDETNEQAAAASGTGATTGTGGSGGQASGTGGSASASTSAAGGGATDCDKVPEYIDNLLQSASACSPADPSLHCTNVVDGYCCPVVVESISSPATQAYLQFLELTKRECPAMWKKCELVDCAFPEPGNCVADATRAGGHCQPFK